MIIIYIFTTTHILEYFKITLIYNFTAVARLITWIEKKICKQTDYDFSKLFEYFNTKYGLSGRSSLFFLRLLLFANE